MRIEYETGHELYSRELPAGLYTRAGVVYLAQTLAEELVGGRFADRCAVAVYDDDGAFMVNLEARYDPKAIKPYPRCAARCCAECFVEVERGHDCPDCGSKRAFDSGILAPGLAAEIGG